MFKLLGSVFVGDEPRQGRSARQDQEFHHMKIEM